VSETAAEKPAFRDAMKWRRCLIPADGFYEWKRFGSKEKQPYNFGMADDSPFAFAGLWERWRDQDNKAIETCTVRGGQTRWSYDVHDRMPAILRPEEYDLWLDPGVTAPSRVIGCLQPFDAKLMKKYPVSTRVNRPENDDPACAQEIPLPNAPQMLF